MNTIPRGWCLFLSRRTRGREPTSATFLLQNGVRIPHPKIEELALQAQGVGIFAKGEIIPTLRTTQTRVVFFFPLVTHLVSRQAHATVPIG